MAELILESVVESITGQVVSLVSEEIGLARSVKTELEKLRNTVSAIGALLIEAEKRRVEAEDVKLWLQNLEDVAYDADDLLDDFSTEVFRRRRVSGRRKRILNEVRIFSSSSNQLVYAFRMAHGAKDIRERLEAIRNDRSDYKVEANIGFGSSVVNRFRPETCSFEHESYAIGRDVDKEKVKEFVMNPDYEENVSVLPIVGVGGLGKTTLARMVFNDKSVKGHFEKKLWVYVSTNFDVEDVLRKIVRECCGPRELGNLNMNELRKELKKELAGKRFFLVLDDVWNENLLKWQKLQGFLMIGAKGSKILVTTRSHRVAATMSETCHKLHGLSDDESLSLLMQKAKKKEDDWRGQSLEVAKEIAKKCVGVPLAIMTIGRLLLHTGHTEEDWSNFKRNDLSGIEQEEGDILPSLKLSYDFLPPHLKKCFAYCSLFPKGCMLDPHDLISLWMAQGFIKSPDNNKTPEEVGHKYFMELVSRSFFEDIEEDRYGSITRCKMHDLKHDLAQMVAGYNCIIINNSRVKEFPKGARHASTVDMEHLKGFEMNNSIRSLLIIGDGGDSLKTPQLDVSRFRNLRALRLPEANIEMLSDSIGELKHLRSLDLSCNFTLSSLPDSIDGLCNLETFNLKECVMLGILPKGITKLVSLRHLDVSGCRSLTHMPRGINILMNLQVLSTFVVGENKNSNAARLNELNELTELKKELSIEKLDRLQSNPSKAGASFSMDKVSLIQSLDLHWDEPQVYNAKDVEVLKRLRPHPNLKRLVIEGFRGARLSSWISQMHKLVEVKIVLCQHCKYLPPLDHLPFLKRIYLSLMDQLKWIELSDTKTPQKSFFPSLEEIELNGLEKFKGWVRRRRLDVGRTEGEDIREDDWLLMLPSFGDKVAVKILSCPRFSGYIHGEQLHLREKENRFLPQLSPYPSTMPPLTSIPSVSFSTLTSLTISDVNGLPPKSFEPLQSLEHLEVNDCHEWRHLPPLDQLPSLKVIHLRRMTNLSWIGLSESRLLESSCFPSLEEVVLVDLYVFKGWGEEDGRC